MLLAIVTVSVRAPERSLVHARRAEALLGPGLWTRVIRISNRAEGGRYPPQVDALVFELEGVLWFYTDTDGTQSLSQLLRHAEQDKAALGPLLLHLNPGFTAWEDAPVIDHEQLAEKTPLPNGCFIESLALLRQRLAAGAPTHEPRLLAYYVAMPGGGVHGHTVLQFRGNEGWIVIDPYRPKKRQRIFPKNPDDAKACADGLRPDVATARQWALPQVAELWKGDNCALR